LIQIQAGLMHKVGTPNHLRRPCLLVATSVAQIRSRTSEGRDSYICRLNSLGDVDFPA